MADRVEYFAVTVPRGTAKSKPQKTKIAFREGIVREVEILVPPGPSGFVGFRLLEASTALIPFTRGSWIVSDDEVIHWPIGSAIESGDWSVEMYNEGVYEHTIQIRFLVDEPGRKGGIGESLGFGEGGGGAAGGGGGFGEGGEGLPGGGPGAGEGETPEPEPEPEGEPEPGPEGEPEPEPSPEGEPEPEAPEGAPAPEESEAAEPESPEEGEEGEVSGDEPKKASGDWVAGAFWHGKGAKRRLWWFYGPPEAAERYRKAHHLKWVFYGTLPQARAWQAKHVHPGHKPKPGHKPRPPAKHKPSHKPKPKPASKPKPKPKPPASHRPTTHPRPAPKPKPKPKPPAPHKPIHRKRK